MARPEFEVPEFVSESDSDQIQERMMGREHIYMVVPEEKLVKNVDIVDGMSG